MLQLMPAKCILCYHNITTCNHIQPAITITATVLSYSCQNLQTDSRRGVI